ncbi:pilus assembly FimT family protein [Rubrobacter calidifluminis]|uniref:pilus assembly FimT family protein n=1 Tax=Rubrobacter calidifluminis TaxID=1392640 RepID=UPI002360EF0A|nr:GspH/FimT family pseudopilin [Rubrobacter calidifluminis]
MRDDRRGQEGFTLPELLVTIVIMGILTAIAIPTWNGIMRQRQVDSATSQLVGDLRLASTRATNQLVDWRVELVSGSGNYLLQRSATSTSGDGAWQTVQSVSLPGGVVSGNSGDVIFHPDGSSEGLAVVTLSRGGSNISTIHIDAATSEVSVGG